MGKRLTYVYANHRLAAIAAMVLLLIPLSLSAQLDKNIFGPSANQQIIQMAMKNAIIVWQQSYRLQKNDDGALYGRDNADEYGHSLSVAVKVKQGVLLTDYAVRPWRYDGVFEEADLGEEFTPILHTSILDGTPKTLAMDTATPLASPLLYLLRAGEETFGGGLNIARPNGEQEGWMVWVTNDKAQPFIINKKTIGFVSEKTVTVLPPTTERTLLGAAFVVPVSPAVGVVEFQLCGMAFFADNAWQVIPVSDALPVKESPVPADTEPSVDIPSIDLPASITPIQDDAAPEPETKTRKNKNKRDKK